MNKLWDKIPAIEYTDGLRLPHTLAAEKADVILNELTNKFVRTMTKGLHRLALQLVALTKENVVGLVQWSSEDTCCYHYFNHEHHETVESEQSETTEGQGKRTTTKTRKVKKGHYQTRHIHHLVNARLHNLGDYRERMPKRVKRFIKTMPPRVRHLFQVLDGQMTLEEVGYRKVAERIDEEVVESTTVYLRDPAVTLGDFALIGWKPDEARREVVEKVQKCWRNAVSIACRVAIIMGAICTIHAVIWLLFSKLPQIKENRVAKETQQAWAAYTSFTADATQKGVTVKSSVGEKLKLGDDVQVLYAGIARSSNWGGSAQTSIKLSCGSAKGRAVYYKLTPLPDSNLYGNVELLDQFGLLLKVHVIHAGENSIEYTVSTDE